MQASEESVNEDSVSLFICADTQHTIHKGLLMLIHTLRRDTLWILEKRIIWMGKDHVVHRYSHTCNARVAKEENSPPLPPPIFFFF